VNPGLNPGFGVLRCGSWIVFSSSTRIPEPKVVIGSLRLLVLKRGMMQAVDLLQSLKSAIQGAADKLDLF
jgi:hypothetical protein